MERRDLEQRLKELRRVEAPQSLDRRMGALFDETGHGLEQQLQQMRQVAAPERLDRRMEALFDEADQDAAVRRPWRLPVWTAAAAGLILVVSLLIRGGLGPAPVVVEITPAGQLEQFLLGGEAAPVPTDLGIFTRGGCSVESVWPADAPGWDRHPTIRNGTNGDH